MKEEIQALFEIGQIKELCDKYGIPFREYLDCRGTLEEELFLIRLECIIRKVEGIDER